MSDNSKKLYQLAIETAVSGGSLSLMEGGKEIDGWIGEGRVSKVEDVLRQIEYLFEKNNVSKNALNAICVSRGPGSYTGARIGIATALGLQKALHCRLAGLSVLEAMSSLNREEARSAVVAVPVGTSRVAWQQIGGEVPNSVRSTEPTRLTGVEEFIELLKADGSAVNKNLIVQRDLYPAVFKNLHNLPHLPHLHCETTPGRKYKLIKVDNLSSLLNGYALSLGSSKTSKNLELASDNISAVYLVNE